MSTTEETLSQKEEYVAQCMTSGKTREECEKLWDESHQPPQQAAGETADYATLKRDYELQKVKIKQLQNALKESVDIIKAVNSERDAITNARKYDLALEIETETEGRVKHDELMKETLKDLATMKKAMDLARPKDFVSVQQLLEQDASKKTPLFTVGQWDPEKKKWVGGT